MRALSEVNRRSSPTSASPSIVKFLIPVKSLFESKTTALLAIAFPTAVFPKSKALSSPTTAVMPSRTFSSAAVDVIAVPLIANLSVTTLNVPLSSIRATSVPSLCWKIISFASTTGLIITSLELLVILSISVPPALNLKSLPPASKIRSAAQSIVKLFAEIVRSVPSPCRS